MAFNTINFIFAFFTTFLISYFLIEDKYKDVVIFLYSIAFYVIGNLWTPIYILIFAVILAINYLFIKCKCYKLLVGLNIVFIIIAKFDFFRVGVPVGLSFYIFSFISLVLDLLKSKKTLSLFEFLSYSLFFPKLLSGPITRYESFRNDLISKKINKENVYNGFCLFCIGLLFKCILADNIFNVINQINVYGFDSISMPTAWLCMYAYTMNLYFDFAGYSLMAIGIAKMIGFILPDNFNEPFSSHSVSEFWRRWHITLGTFFKDYVYIPLGGNRKGIVRQCINIIIVWILTGLWHGFSINFVVWALLIGCFIIIEKLVLIKFFEKYKLCGLILVNLFIPFTFVIFTIPSIDAALIFIKKLFDFDSLNNMSEFILIIKRYYKIILIGIIFMTVLPRFAYEKIRKNKVLMLIICAAAFALSIYMIKVGANDAFKYFSF